MVCKNGYTRIEYNVSRYYINDASILFIVAACTCVYPKNMALGQVVTNIVGHVDTVLETKQVHTRTTLKSKYVATHGVNRWNSLSQLRKLATLPRFKK